MCVVVRPVASVQPVQPDSGSTVFVFISRPHAQSRVRLS